MYVHTKPYISEDVETLKHHNYEKKKPNEMD